MKNVDHVAVYPDRGATFWEFVVPSAVETCAEQSSEVVAFCDSLFTCFEDYLRPTEIDYYVHRFPEGQRLPVTVDHDALEETVHRQVQDKWGISFDEFQTSARITGSGSTWLPRIGFDETSVRLRLDTGDVWVSGETYTVPYHAGEPDRELPSCDPLELTVVHAKNTSYDSIDAPYVLSLLVTPYSDIWFEDSDLGEVNRRRLASFLERIERRLPVAVLDRTSDWLPVEELEVVY